MPIGVEAGRIWKQIDRGVLEPQLARPAHRVAHADFMLVLETFLTANVERSPIAVDAQRHWLQLIVQAVAVVVRIFQVAEIVEIAECFV